MSGTVAGRRLGRYLILPLLGILVFAGLVVAQASGSSIGILETKEAAQESVLFGRPREIRADEYNYLTPLQISQTRTGFPNQRWVGLNDMQTPVFASLSTSQYIEVIRPYNWGFHLLGPAYGLAWFWWLPILLCALGLYFLAALIRAGPWLSAVVAIIGTFNPYTAWWASGLPTMTIATASFALGFTILAIKAERARTAVGFGVLAGVTVAAAFFVLYPPWTISVGLVTLAVLVGLLIDNRVRIKRIGLIAAFAAPIIAALVLPWMYLNREGLTALANTIYPGSRTSHSGEYSLPDLLTAPTNIWLSRTNVDFKGSNYSEISSAWFPVIVLLLGAILAVAITWRSRLAVADSVAPTDTTPRAFKVGTWSILGALASTLLILLWAVAPIPNILGRLFGLGFVPGNRTPLALGFGAVMILLLVAVALKGRDIPRWTWAVLAAAVLVSIPVALVVFAGLPIRDVSVGAGAVSAAVGAAILAAGFGLLMFNRWRLVAGGVLVLYCCASYALVNPLYRGIGPFEEGELNAAAAARPPQTKVAFIAGGGRANAILLGSHLQLISGLTVYPDAQLMESLAPGQRAKWNNYTYYLWHLNSSLETATIERISRDSAILRINPCSESTQSIGIEWYIAREPLRSRCLKPELKTTSGDQTYLWHRVVEP